MLSQALCLKSIVCVTSAPSMSVRITSKIVLSLLLVFMDEADLAHLQLKVDEASHLVQLLCVATSEGQASEGLATYALVDLLVSFINLSSLAKNKVIIIESGIVEPLQLLILNDDYKVQEQSLRLVWTLLSGTQLSTQVVRAEHLDLRLMLRFIHESPSIILSLIAQCVLKTTYWDTPEGREYRLYTMHLSHKYISGLYVSIQMCERAGYA